MQQQQQQQQNKQQRQQSIQQWKLKEEFFIQTVQRHCSIGGVNRDRAPHFNTNGLVGWCATKAKYIGMEWVCFLHSLSHFCLFNVYITLGNRWYVAVFIRKFVLSFHVRLRRRGAQPSVREFFPVWLLQKWNLFFLVYQAISAYTYTHTHRNYLMLAHIFLSLSF